MANWWAAVGWFSDCNPNANKNNICPYEFKISLSSRRRPAFGGLLAGTPYGFADAVCRHAYRHGRPRPCIHGRQRPVRRRTARPHEHPAVVGLDVGLPHFRHDGHRFQPHPPERHRYRRPVRCHGDARRGAGDLCPRHGGRPAVGHVVVFQPRQ